MIKGFVFCLATTISIFVCAQNDPGAKSATSNNTNKLLREKLANIIPITYEELQRSSRLNIETIYFVTTTGREGLWKWNKDVPDNNSDNDGTIVVNSGLQQFTRIYEGGINAAWFGVVADAVIPSRGIHARGTNNTPALQKAIDAAGENEKVYIGAGNYLFATPLDTIKGTKAVNLEINGNTFHNGANFIVINNPSGAYEKHTIVHNGEAFGSINQPAHNFETYSRGTGPRWDSYKGRFLEIFNAFRQVISLNSVSGFDVAVVISGANAGSQENKIVTRHIYNNNIGFLLESKNGKSYVDKNDIYCQRLSGNIGLVIDGYAKPVMDDATKKMEAYNGAARANRFHIMFEALVTAMILNGDITTPQFDIIAIEGGKKTGIFGRDKIICGSHGANVVQGPRWFGGGILSRDWMGTEAGNMGYNGTIEMQIWDSDEAGSTVRVANRANIDRYGKIVLEVDDEITSYRRSRFPSSLFDFKRVFTPKELIITETRSTVPKGISDVLVKSKGATITLPNKPIDQPDRRISVRATGDFPVTVAGVARGQANVVPANKKVTYVSKLGGWYVDAECDTR